MNNTLKIILLSFSIVLLLVGCGKIEGQIVEKEEKPRYIITMGKLRLLNNLENRGSIGEFIPSGTKLEILDEQINVYATWYLTSYKDKIGWINSRVSKEIGLDRNSGIEILLPEDVHLEDTYAGAWIKAFKLDYNASNSYITEKMELNISSLSTIGILAKDIQDEDIYTSGWVTDKYSENEDSLTRVWLVTDSKRMKIKSIYPFTPRSVFGNPRTEVLVINETLQDGMQPRWTLRLEPPGLEWEHLLKEHGQELLPNRESECAVIITSNADNGAKLYLFGWGKYCTEISLF